MSDTEYRRVFNQLKPALIRMGEDEAFRERFEASPLSVLRELGIEVSDDLAEEMAGKTFSAFWSAHRARAEGRVQVRDLPPSQLSDAELGSVVAGAKIGSLSMDTASLSEDDLVSRFAPPYVPVGPVVSKK
jgi:hypothetical protein